MANVLFCSILILIFLTSCSVFYSFEGISRADKNSYDNSKEVDRVKLLIFLKYDIGKVTLVL